MLFPFDDSRWNPEDVSISAPLHNWYRKWYRFPMSLNLRLSDDLAAGLRSLAQDTGRSQQALIREAIEMYLRDYKVQAYPPEIRYAITPATTTYEAALEEVKAMGYLETLTDKESMLATLQELREDRV
jgi:hypothetical protein